MADVDLLLMVEKGTKWEMGHSIHRYTKANNKRMIDYDPSIESSYLNVLDFNNLYGWAMSQKMPV